MGCMVMIPGAATLYDVRKTTSLLNYIMTRNAHETVRKVRGRIVRSCAGACLLAFAMGLGDRHLENILVGSDGSLAHVDFGFVLGEDPKHVSTPMRIQMKWLTLWAGMRHQPLWHLSKRPKRDMKPCDSMRVCGIIYWPQNVIYISIRPER